MYCVTKGNNRRKRRAQAPAARVTQPSTVQLWRILLIPMFDLAQLPRSTIETEHRNLRRRQVQRRSANGIDDQIGQRIVVEWRCNHERHIVECEALAVVADDALVTADCCKTRYDAIIVVGSAVANGDEY